MVFKIRAINELLRPTFSGTLVRTVRTGSYAPDGNHISLEKTSVGFWQFVTVFVCLF